MAAQLVYVARHGLTEGNIAQTVQGFDDPLAEQGHRQAMRLSERAKHLEFDHLIASDMLRAQQTAAYIAQVTGHAVITQPLVQEVLRPRSLWGLSSNEPAYQAFLKHEAVLEPDPQWHIDHGERFPHIQKRALDALDYFASFGQDTLFVVSHGHFVRCLVATIMMERSLTQEVWTHSARTLRTHNTGITILRRDIESDHWSILSFNDHSHFADA
jgi:broad specificity phosphatase PhoE